MDHPQQMVHAVRCHVGTPFGFVSTGSIQHFAQQGKTYMLSGDEESLRCVQAGVAHRSGEPLWVHLPDAERVWARVRTQRAGGDAPRL